MDLQRLEDLISDYLDGTLSPGDLEELTRELRANPEARRRLLTAADQDLAVQELARSLKPSETSSPARRPTGHRPLTRRMKAWRDASGWNAALIAASVIFGIAVLFSLSLPGSDRPKVAGKDRAPRGAAQEETLRRAEQERALAEAARKEAEARLEALRREEARLEVERKKPAPDRPEDLVLRADQAFQEAARKRKEEEERLVLLKRQEESAKQAVERAAAPASVQPGTTPAAEALARVERVEGEAWAVSADKRSALAAGDSLLPEQGLDVGTRGRLVLAYPDQTRVELGPGTKVRALSEQPRKDGIGKWIEVLEGRVLAKVTRQSAGQALAIGTPHAEARVLGTTLRIIVDSSSTRLEVETGRVRLKRLADGKTVDVISGQYAIAAAGVELAARALHMYSEDFDSGRLSGWSFTRAYPWTVERASRGSVLASPRYALDQIVPEAELLAVLGGKSWKDCAVEADVRLEELPGSGLAGFVLYARYQDWANLVRLEYLRSPRGLWTAAIDQGRPGAPGDVSTKPAPALEVGRTYRARLELRGDQVSAFLDDQELVRSPTLFDGPGTIALGAPRGRWSFDAIRVVALPPLPKGEGRGGSKDR